MINLENKNITWLGDSVERMFVAAVTFETVLTEIEIITQFTVVSVAGHWGHLAAIAPAMRDKCKIIKINVWNLNVMVSSNKTIFNYCLNKLNMFSTHRKPVHC